MSKIFVNHKKMLNIVYIYFMTFVDTPPNLCLTKDCTNAAGCTLDSDGGAICFCTTGYQLLVNDTCVSKSQLLFHVDTWINGIYRL